MAKVKRVAPGGGSIRILFYHGDTKTPKPGAPTTVSWKQEGIVKGVAAEIEEMKVVLKVVVPVAESWKTKERGQGEETKRNAGREKDHNSNSINNTVRNFLKWTPTPSCDGLGYHWYLRGTSRSLRQTRKINTA
ncbi:hypothetical protein RUM43_012664 [Polyplax serrata]|uniref:Uncharacterized protein n=1 Tax=Polyplax serrata TaxID=468196 RepID=A0AAN8P2B9_POLSC